LSHRSHPCLRVRCLLRERRSRRASCASALCGQGNIDHETASVKKVCAHFCSSSVAHTVVPLQVAPTEVQGPNCPKHTVKITRQGFDVRPCSRGYDRCADGAFHRLVITTATTNYGARAVQKCQLSGIVPPKMPTRHWDRLTKEKAIHCSKIRTWDTTGLRKQDKNRSQRNQSLRAPSQAENTRMGAMATALSGHARFELSCPSRAVSMAQSAKAHKKRRPFASGHGLRGGRWPGPQVERDGLSCYCGRGWVSERSDNSMAAAISLGGIAATGVVSLKSHTRPASDRFIGAQKSFLMATFADQTTGHGRLP
jgi:hypothetical protein